jgi:flagellar hook-associated protein 1 FlgK
MQNYSIGLSGLNAAQRALDTIGNNMANAATEGYHRQRLDLVPAYSSQAGSVVWGGGVDVAGVSRIMDILLEHEILRQQSSLGQTAQELATLQNIENAFGELSGGGSLNTTIDEFFSALQALAAHPSQIIWQDQAVTAGEALAAQFRTLGEFFNRLELQIVLEAENTIDRINALINQISELKSNIEAMEIRGGVANNLRDQRDQRISELSELAEVEVQSREHGVADVSIAGVPVVIGSSAIELEVGLTEGNYMGVSAAGSQNYSTDIRGGQLGGLLSLRNGIVRGVYNDLDTLVRAIIQQVNQYHVQGLGSEGSFTELTGWVMTGEELADFDPPVTNGSIFIRLTDISTGQITRHEVDVDVSTDSISTIAAKINDIDGLTASVVSSKLRIQADTNYEFDFIPAVLPEPTVSNLTAASPPSVSVSGIYNGTENDTFTFTVVGTGSVGNGNLQLEVRNDSAEVITTLSVGAGYAADDKLDLGNGIKVSLSTGDLNAGDTFEIDAFASTDTSGFLSAVGINTFFFGHSALDIDVCSDIRDVPGRVATALGSDLTDNTNALRLAGLSDEALDSLGSMTVGEFYRRLATNIGQEISIKQMRHDNTDVMLQNLNKRQTEISGVNINDEAAQILVFEQMFQAMAKYLSTVQSVIMTLMELAE